MKQVVEKPSSRQVWWVLGVFVTGGGVLWRGPFSRRIFFWFRALNINKLLSLTATCRFSYLKAEMATTVRCQAFVVGMAVNPPSPSPPNRHAPPQNLKQPLCRHILFLAQHIIYIDRSPLLSGVRMKEAEREEVVARFPFH